MATANIVTFNARVVREMTREEHLEQRRRVLASLCQEHADKRPKDSFSSRLLKAA
jgi:hypothetical protein